MNQKTSWWRGWEITIDSNWIEVIVMAIILVASGLLLVRDAGHLILGNFTETPPPISNNRFTNILDIGGTAYLFVLAFVCRAKFLKVALGLMATDLAGRMALGYFHAALAVQDHAAVAGSVFRQIAYTILLVATLQWFRSVVRWVPPSKLGESDCDHSITRT